MANGCSILLYEIFSASLRCSVYTLFPITSISNREPALMQFHLTFFCFYYMVGPFFTTGFFLIVSIFRIKKPHIFNMHFILRYAFDISYTLPQIVAFWVYTITGLGVYVIFRYVINRKTNDVPASVTAITHFNCVVDGIKQQIPLEQILYIESLENYIKVITTAKTYLARLPMKDAEESLPKPAFIRISRSHIVNTAHIATMDGENISIRDQQLKVGKVYKRYVEDQLNAIRMKNS